MPSFPNYAEGSRKGMVQQVDTNSITTFKELSVQFASIFIKGYWCKKSTTCLMSIKK